MQYRYNKSNDKSYNKFNNKYKSYDKCKSYNKYKSYNKCKSYNKYKSYNRCKSYNKCKSNNKFNVQNSKSCCQTYYARLISNKKLFEFNVRNCTIII